MVVGDTWIIWGILYVITLIFLIKIFLVKESSYRKYVKLLLVSVCLIRN